VNTLYFENENNLIKALQFKSIPAVDEQRNEPYIHLAYYENDELDQKRIYKTSISQIKNEQFINFHFEIPVGELDIIIKFNLTSETPDFLQIQNMVVRFYEEFFIVSSNEVTFKIQNNEITTTRTDMDNFQIEIIYAPESKKPNQKDKGDYTILKEVIRNLDLTTGGGNQDASYYTKTSERILLGKRNRIVYKYNRTKYVR
jgi:hypothetical protein